MFESEHREILNRGKDEWTPGKHDGQDSLHILLDSTLQKVLVFVTK